MDLFTSVDARPHPLHESLRYSVAKNPPVENLADGSLCSEYSPISISGRGLQRDRGAIPSKPSDGGATKAILGPRGRHSGTVPERQTQR